MNTETELIDMALAVSAASGSVADAVKKAIFHNHGIDWPLLLTLAEVLRVNAATLALLAEQQIERGHVERLSNVTLEPTAQVQP